MEFRGVQTGELLQEGISEQCDRRAGSLIQGPPDTSTEGFTIPPHSDEQPGTECCKALNRILIIPSGVCVRGRQNLLAAQRDSD